MPFRRSASLPLFSFCCSDTPKCDDDIDNKQSLIAEPHSDADVWVQQLVLQLWADDHVHAYVHAICITDRDCSLKVISTRYNALHSVA